MEKDISKEYICFKALCKVYFDNAYSHIILGDFLKGAPANDRAYITQLFYGVIENDVQFEYMIGKLTSKKPKKKCMLILKMGLYFLRYADMPDYAAIDKAVTLCKKAGKKDLSGFVNAVLRKSVDIEIPRGKDALSLSLNYNCPEWITEKLLKRYGFNFTEDLLKRFKIKKTHIRHNGIKSSYEVLAEKIPQGEKTETGFYIDNAYKKLDENIYVVQSLASTIAVNCYLSLCAPKKILDLCAAPGGKTAYMYELSKAEITAAEIYPHRAELIRKYLEKVGAKAEICVNDAVILNKAWLNGFDLVVCDVPCSGTGIIGSRPDVILNRRQEDIKSLSALQREILLAAGAYVKEEGFLCYSTCSLLKEENEDVCLQFLDENKDFFPADMNFNEHKGSMINLYPHIDNCDGFFVAAFKKTKKFR